MKVKVIKEYDVRFSEGVVAWQVVMYPADPEQEGESLLKCLGEGYNTHTHRRCIIRQASCIYMEGYAQTLSEAREAAQKALSAFVEYARSALSAAEEAKASREEEIVEL